MTKILSPVSIPYNATAGNIYTQQEGEKDYNWKEALQGRKPKYENTALSIFGDPLNYLGGLGLSGKISKLGKYTALGEYSLKGALKNIDNIENSIIKEVKNYRKGLKNIPSKTKIIKTSKRNLLDNKEMIKAISEIDDPLIRNHVINTYIDERVFENSTMFETPDDIRNYNNLVKKLQNDNPELDLTHPLKYNNSKSSFHLNPDYIDHFVREYKFTHNYIKQKAKMYDDLYKKYNRKLSFIKNANNKELLNIAETSPQYIDEIFKHLNNPIMSDDAFVNNLVKKSNTFVRSITKDIPGPEILNIQGQSMVGTMNHNSIDVTSISKNGDLRPREYGSYAYKIEPTDEFMSYIEKLKLEDKWKNRFPELNPLYDQNIARYEGIYGKDHPQIDDFDLHVNQNRNKEKLLLYDDYYISNNPIKIYENDPKFLQYIYYIPHQTFKTPLKEQILKGFKGSKINLKDILAKDYSKGYSLLPTGILGGAYLQS